MAQKDERSFALERVVLSFIFLLISLSTFVFLTFNPPSPYYASATIHFQKGPQPFVPPKPAVPPERPAIKQDTILFYSCIDENPEYFVCDPVPNSVLSSFENCTTSYADFSCSVYKQYLVKDYPELNEHIYIIFSGYSTSDSVFVTKLGLVINFDTPLQPSDTVFIDDYYSVVSVSYDQTGVLSELSLTDTQGRAYRIFTGADFKGNTVLIQKNSIIIYRPFTSPRSNYELMGHTVRFVPVLHDRTSVVIKKDSEGTYHICGNDLDTEVKEKVYSYGNPQEIAAPYPSGPKCFTYKSSQFFDSKGNSYDNLYINLADNHILILSSDDGIMIWEPTDIIYLKKEQSGFVLAGYKYCDIGRVTCYDYELSSIMSGNVATTHYGTILMNKNGQFQEIYLSIPQAISTFSVEID